MDLGLKSKRALVCGASKGLGFAVAKSLAAEGCNLIICSRSADDIQRAASTLKAEYGVHVEGLTCDLSDAKDREALIQESKMIGHVDILVNNAGGPTPSSASSTSAEEWTKGFSQLFLSTVQLSQHFMREMQSSKFGRILTITSISVVEPIENLAVSTAMRAAITGFHKTLATEVASSDITVNTVMPGIIHTDRIDFLRGEKAKKLGTTLEIELKKTAVAVPMQRMGRPEELADFVCFLASEKASYITGQNFCVDGGLRRSW